MRSQLAFRLESPIGDEIVVDLFAGGGGASQGIEEGLGVRPYVAINHDWTAIQMHQANHPETLHLREDLFRVIPTEVVGNRKVGLLWASPDCRHFSRAKGAKPVSKKIRSLASVVIRWAKQVKPRVIILENVPEFRKWGPLIGNRPDPKRAGNHFQKWLFRLRAEGYHIEWRVIRVADIGVPTSRERLFLVARRDGKPIRWPALTHGPGRAHPWLQAGDYIDWSIPCRSIFGRQKPLAEKTLARIARGAVRFVIDCPDPYLVKIPHGQPAGSDVVGAFLAKHYTGVTGQMLNRPLGTITATDHHSLVTARLQRAPWDPDGASRVAAFLIQFYGSGTDSQRVDLPLRTVVTKARHGLVTVVIDGEELAVVDIGLRMLTPRELALCQGFPADYILTGSQASQIAKIGNSVPPEAARRMVVANLLEEEGMYRSLERMVA